MKTNQILIRQMGNFGVSQRTSDGKFNATELLRQWNESSGQQKQMIHYFENSATDSFINALISEEDLKERNSVFIKSRGKNGGTWMHPLLFIDFAMWLNPSFKVKVLRFVYDQLIKYRNEAGDTYMEMCASIASIVKKDKIQIAIQSIARAINHIVYGDHERNIRNTKAEEDLMLELVDLQKFISKSINDKLLPNLDSVMNYLRYCWRKKYEPKILSA